MAEIIIGKGQALNKSETQSDKVCLTEFKKGLTENMSSKTFYFDRKENETHASNVCKRTSFQTKIDILNTQSDATVKYKGGSSMQHCNSSFEKQPSAQLRIYDSSQFTCKPHLESVLKCNICGEFVDIEVMPIHLDDHSLQLAMKLTAEESQLHMPRISTLNSMNKQSKSTSSASSSHHVSHVKLLHSVDLSPIINEAVVQTTSKTAGPSLKRSKVQALLPNSLAVDQTGKEETIFDVLRKGSVEQHRIQSKKSRPRKRFSVARQDQRSKQSVRHLPAKILTEIEPSSHAQQVKEFLSQGKKTLLYRPVTYPPNTSFSPEIKASHEGLFSKIYAAFQSQNLKSATVASEITLCRFNRVFHQKYRDRLWSCGFRNMQTVVDALVNTEEYRSRLFGGIPTIPAIFDLQREIERAWTSGFDPEGAKQLAGTNHWIGSTEVCALFRFYGLDAHVATFYKTHQRDCEGCYSDLVDWVWHYFNFGIPATSIQPLREYCAISPGIFVSEMPPLYFQHDGHSRTLIGLERRRESSGIKINLLLLDPQTNPRMLQCALQTSGWEKHIKRGQHTLRNTAYQIVFTRGVLTEVARENLKLFT